MAQLNAGRLAEEPVGMLMRDERNYRDRTITINGIKGYGPGVDIIAISVDEAETVAERFIEDLIERYGIKDPDEEA